MTSKKILITGGAGYIGSCLIRKLAKKYPKLEIIVLDNFLLKRYEGFMDLPEDYRVKVVEGDIFDQPVLKSILKDVDTLIHLAAIVRTPMSFENPTGMSHVNHWGTSLLVQACIENGVRNFVYTSSIAVYGPGDKLTESSECRPVGPYGESKLKAEQEVLKSQKFGLNTFILRLGMVFGMSPNIRFEGVVNKFALHASLRNGITIHGRGSQKRPIVHIDDMCNAMSLVMEHDNCKNEIYNVVSRNASILDIADATEVVLPKIGKRFTDQNSINHLTFDVDSQKLKNLGWFPKVSLENGIKEVVDRFSKVDTYSFPDF